MLVLAGGGVLAFALRNVGPFKDSGVAMCERIRDAKAHNTTVNLGGSTADGKLTVDEYHKLRKPFADSRYPDLRDAGTKLADLAWQVDQMMNSGGSTSDSGGFGAALLMGGQIMGAYSSLAGACANHGVDLPAFSSGTR